MLFKLAFSFLAVGIVFFEKSCVFALPECGTIDPGLFCDMPERKLEEALPSCDDVDPGIMCTPSSHTRQLQASTNLEGIYQTVGNVYVSIEGKGVSGSGSVDVWKKTTDSKVKKAYLFASTYSYSSTIVTLLGTQYGTASNPWDKSGSVFYLNSYASDVTSIIQPFVDAQSPGIIPVPFSESPTGRTDGVILAVVFDEPTEPNDTTVALLFGGLSQTGDSFILSFGSPITPAFLSDPASKLELSLGIGFGFQDSPVSNVQFSTVVSACLY